MDTDWKVQVSFPTSKYEKFLFTVMSITVPGNTQPLFDGYRALFLGRKAAKLWSLPLNIYWRGSECMELSLRDPVRFHSALFNCKVTLFCYTVKYPPRLSFMSVFWE